MDAAAVLERGVSGGEVSPGELAELLSVMNEVTTRLQSTHETLRAEVARLQAELSETRSQLRRKSELAALGEMAAGIAHEVRNPLGSIRLYASALEEDLGDRPGERVMAGKIVRAVRGLDAVVGDVLTFAREMRVHPEETGVEALVDEALRACADLVEPAREVRVVRERGEAVAVRCDPSLVQQALVNVVRNAAEAVLEGGSGSGVLVVSAGKREVLDERGRRGPMASVRVADSGPGIEAGVMDRLFNPFFTTRASGTGLGLAIVHRIMDAHGGRVVITNGTREDASGACVELLLPLGSGGEEASRTRGDCS